MKPGPRAAVCLCLWLALAVPFLPATAVAPVVAVQPPASPFQRYVKTTHLIPMRDGVKLYTTVWTPKDAKGPLPFILERTPYSADGSAFQFNAYLQDLPNEDYH